MAWIERYGHGGDLHTASMVFGIGQEELLDFSANINPLGPPHELLTEITHGLKSIIHYPDPAHRSFRGALANKLDIDADCILPGNGAAECMALAIQGLAPRRIGVVYPCFSEYARLAAQFGAEVTGCYGQDELNYKPRQEELFQLFQHTDLVFIGHPNNPTGITYSLAELMEMAAWAELTSTYLIIDEAFIDFLQPKNQITLLPQLDQFPHVILIRSMTKFYAIPGLRLGFAVGHSHVIDKLKHKQVTWSVNQLALLAGELCLHLSDYEIQTRQLIEQQRSFLIHTIEEDLKWKVCPGEANFLLVRLPETIKSADLQMDLGQQGIMIRDCSMYPGLSPQDFRIAVRTEDENIRLLAALKQCTMGKGSRA
jgi:threonine-phosphate decarboxylase